jgi:hypothetical protein
MTEQADLKRHLRAGEPRSRDRLRAALHVTNGDSTAVTLRQTGLAARLVVWRDVLHEGPVPAVDDGELREIRARFLGGADAEAVQRTFEERDRALTGGRDGEYVLWFEADLYDQLQLAQILAQLAELDVAPERVTLICIGEHLGIAHFGGLGELGPEQLAQLPARAAVALTADALQLAAQAWTALRAPDPRGLAAIVVARSPELRFLPEAFDRLAREYPSTRDGLSLTERRLLAAVADGAPTAADAFLRACARESRPFLGDTWAFAALERLAAGDAPLIDAEAPVGRRTPLRLTAAGRDVLDGRADQVALNGVDRWVGGVRLRGRSVAWRWDEGTETLVPSAGA